MDSILERLFGASAGPMQGLLTPDERNAALSQGLLSAGAQILAASAPAANKPSLGAALGQGLVAGQQGYQGAIDQSITQRQEMMKLRQAQMQNEALQQVQGEVMEALQGGAAPAPATAAASPAGGLTPAGGAPAPTAPEVPRNKRLAEVYRTAAARVAAVNPQAAERYIKLADGLDPREEFGTTAQEVTGPDGKPRLMRFGKYGTAEVVGNATPNIDTAVVDAGDRQLLIDRRDPTRVLGVVPKGFSPDAVLLNARQGQVTQQENAVKAAEAASTAQSAISAYDQALGSIRDLLGHEGLSAAAGIGSMFPTTPGSKAADFEAKLETLKAQTFLPMVQVLRGMGALSNAEGDKLSNAIGALSIKQSDEQLKRELMSIASFLQQKRESAAKGAERTIGALSGQTRARDVAVPGQPVPRNSGTGIAAGTTRTLNGKTYRFDGIGWMEAR